MKNIILTICAVLSFVIFSCCSNDDDLEVFSTLYGTVTETETGDPVNNATIMLTPGGKTTISGSDGSFQFDDIDAGQYTITVQKEGYVTNRKTATAVSGEKVKVDIPLVKKSE